MIKMCFIFVSINAFSGGTYKMIGFFHGDGYSISKTISRFPNVCFFKTLKNQYVGFISVDFQRQWKNHVQKRFSVAMDHSLFQNIIKIIPFDIHYTLLSL